MKYRLAAADLDGTLLDANSELTEETVKAVKAAQDAGLIFTISTGRAQNSIMGFISKLGINCPVITYNGAMLIKPDGEIIYRCDLESDDAVDAYNMGADLGVDMVVWSDNRVYFSRMTSAIERYRSMYPKAECFVIGDRSEIYDIVKNGISKIIFVDTPENTERNQRLIQERFGGRIAYFRSSSFYLELVNKSVSKGTALMKLAEHYGIPREQTAAFGDQKNDMPMIEAAGLGVAMENAVDELKSIADYITLPNTENGVAAVLYKMIEDSI